MRAFRFANNKSKYKAKPTLGFPSKLEHAVYRKLQDREVLGLIKDIKRQQSVVLLEAGEKQNRVTWKVDFQFFNCQTNQVEYAEAKGVETGEYRLKLKLWRAHRHEALEIWKGRWTRPILTERIEAKEVNNPHLAVTTKE